MMQLLETFRDFGYTVIFGSTATPTPYSLDLDAMQVESVSLQMNHSSFDKFIQDLKPHIVVFDRFITEEQFGWRVAECAPQAVRVLNTEDLHSLRKSREDCYKIGEGFNVNHWKNHPMALRELASIYRSDLSLMVSSYEMQLLTQEAKVPDNILLYLPLMAYELYPDDVLSWPNFNECQDFVCVGNGKHAPNVEAIKTLKKNIWPQIKKALPNTRLLVYGAYLPQQVLEMHNPKEGFEVKGWVEDLDAVLQNARLLLAPIQFGAGIKGKLIDAMSNGTPSITTPVGAEGMNDNFQWPGFICPNLEGFAQCAIELYQNQEKWSQAQTHGIMIINSLYAKRKLQDKFIECLENLGNQLEIHRTQNLVGKMLHQQGLAATKYMGKWIEEKNKPK
ncbi:glycosyltransferase family 4 protein [Flagellimonas algicola]|uniref:Glycosyltransferase family 4 protein n=2 Tax=Flagellimonas algicola TaxID=2583815 RepID=A0ABY2WRQ7_9FLAO|nr:glycosyltransferase family 4 protein [Allomuricauda algicola]